MTGETSSNGTSPAPVPAVRSCLECRRLKRKCDRLFPCDVCTRHGKECSYPPRARRGPDAVVDARLDPLRQLLAKHAPDVDPDEEDAADEPQRQRRRISETEEEAGDHATASFSYAQAAQTSPLDHAGPNSEPGQLQSVLDLNPSPSSFTHLSPSSTLHTHRIEQPPPPTFQPSAFPPHSVPNPAPFLSSGVAFRHPQPTSTTEALEKQPRHAAGYEWNERRQTTVRGTDGTASLSMEPDGQGYLGFAAGATLLRMLQLCAGAVSIGPASAVPTRAVSVEPAGWEPSHTDSETYINAYFQFYHVQYPLVHEPTFRAQWSEVIASPPKSQWEPLVNVVLGLGAFCSFQPMYKIDYFLERATASLSVEHLESGSLTLVQAFTLLSNLTQKRNKPNSGFVYLGIAVRMAIGLGLHRELPSWNITSFEREVRRRVWWVVFCFDSGASITFGRPILLPSGDADVKVVHNVADRAFTPSAAVVPPASPVPTMYTSLIHQSSFHTVGNDCYTRTISSPPPSSTDILALDSKLQLWYSSLPEWIKPYSPTYPWLSFSAQKLFWRYSNLRIILHRRAFLERALKGLSLWTGALEGQKTAQEPEALCSDMCLQSASASILAINHFFKTRTPNRLEWWYGLHFLFHASFVPLIALHSDSSSPQRPSWHEDVDLARNTLSELREDPLAERCLMIINRLAPSSSPAPGSSALAGDLEVLNGMLQSNPAWLGAGSESAESW